MNLVEVILSILPWSILIWNITAWYDVEGEAWGSSLIVLFIFSTLSTENDKETLDAIKSFFSEAGKRYPEKSFLLRKELRQEAEALLFESSARQALEGFKRSVRERARQAEREGSPGAATRFLEAVIAAADDV